MLVYLFWHWPRDGVDRQDYERLQRRFHAALRDAPPPGFLESRSEAISGAPWIPERRDAYEDWYLLENAASLDPLNEAAISAPRKVAHDAAAAGAAGGTAGLYKLRQGDGRSVVPTVAAWFGKPAGMTYASLDEALHPLVTGKGAVLWMRQMVLGPTPEFCLQSTTPLTLPPQFQPIQVQSRRVWPEGTG